MAKRKRATIAIVGIGRWGKNLVREFSKLADVRYCYHSGNQENARWLKDNYPGIPQADSYEDILNDSAVDAVVIATPVKTHFTLARKALRAGKHVFLEKPIAETPAQARVLVRESLRSKKVLFAGYIFAYHPVVPVLLRVLRKDKPVYAALEWNKYGTFKEDIRHNLLSHELSLAYLLFGVPSRSRLLKCRGVVSACDILTAELDFPDFRCDIRINRTANFRQKSVLVVGRKNTLLWEGEHLWKLSGDTHRVSFVFSSKRAPLEIECREFIRALPGREKPLTGGAFGVKISELLAGIRKK